MLTFILSERISDGKIFAMKINDSMSPDCKHLMFIKAVPSVHSEKDMLFADCADVSVDDLDIESMIGKRIYTRNGAVVEIRSVYSMQFDRKQRKK